MTAVLVATDRYWDGYKYAGEGRNVYLYRAQDGEFFLQRTSLWPGERNSIIEVLSLEGAKKWYGHLSGKERDYVEAFGQEIKEAQSESL